MCLKMTALWKILVVYVRVYSSGERRLTCHPSGYRHSSSCTHLYLCLNKYETSWSSGGHGRFDPSNFGNGPSEFDRKKPKSHHRVTRETKSRFLHVNMSVSQSLVYIWFGLFLLLP